jgi:hypothetical protein
VVDRIGTLCSVLTQARPCAGIGALARRMEDEDNRKGPEPEPENTSTLRGV